MIIHVWVLRDFDECLFGHVNVGSPIERGVFDTLSSWVVLGARDF